NPTLSAKQQQFPFMGAALRNGPFGTNPRLSAWLLCRTDRFFVSKSNPLRWALIWVFRPFGHESTPVGVAPLPDGPFLRFQIKPAPLDFDLGV
ncbi:MAG: hypothetical protein PUF46_05270, partial [Oscillospiraceae bacterium]|nr:hypothetical protein [Oscillospiraceae bacterium]